MKTRISYVSNSSSSSFICEDCGRMEAGYDLSLDDAGMIRCENDHVVCSDHLSVNIYDIDIVRRYLTARLTETIHEDTRKLIQKSLDILVDFNDIDIRNCETEIEKDLTIAEFYDDLISDFGYPKERCTICMMKVMKDDEALWYLLKTCGKTDKELLKEVHDKFKTYEEFKGWLKS